MKKIYILSALLCASAFSFTACVEENFEKPTPANDGDEIVFGARAGFESPATKTVYSGEFYTVDGKKFERIDWIDTEDAIQIYCPEAEGPNPSHYTVNHAADPDAQKDYAYLVRNGGSSLQWNGDGVHHFYAMYPSSDMFDNEQTTLASGIVMDGTVLRGTVPGAQNPVSVKQDGNNWVAAPNMKYAYMAAKSAATREDGSVSLSFVPIVTAVQIQLTLAAGELVEPVSIAEIQVQGSGIVGDFHADLSEDAWTGTYPECVNDGDGNGIIQVSMWQDSKPITVSPGQTLTFTVFLRPGADYKNLKVSYSPTGAGYVGKTMGESVQIKKNLKTVITGFKLPAKAVAVDASKWMTQVSDELEFKKLSIPGTGGSFSYRYTSDQNGYFRSQHTNMTIAEQWKVGIRAFEIISDRSSNTSASLGDENVTCNKNSVGLTVNAAMSEINTLLEANPDECAVVIFTYQPEGSSPSRNAEGYANNLKVWYNNLSYKDKFKLYEPGLTLGDVRGKILTIVRLNQRDEKDGSTFAAAVTALSETPFLLVDGCGTAKDKWGARGYTITANGQTITAPDISNSADTFIEEYMEDGYLASTGPDKIYPTNHANVGRTEMNFVYKTSDPDITCWYQEWARVIPTNTLKDGGWLGSDYYWFESYNEKLYDAVETFKMAISDQYTDYVFVNTLCGYMATEATAGSPTNSLTASVGWTYGGDGGDIDALAERLNVDFYKAVLEAGMEQTTGPTGVVMMDYVTNEPASDTDGSYYLPGVIVANNFKYAGGNGNNTPDQGGNGGNGDNNTEQPDEEEGGI